MLHQQRRRVINGFAQLGDESTAMASFVIKPKLNTGLKPRETGVVQYLFHNLAGVAWVVRR